MSHCQTGRPCVRSSRLQAAALVAAALLPAGAHAAVEWHPDLETARAAARISRRPVLAVLVATPATRDAAGEFPCLRSDEAEALLATCFEPVRVDAHARPALAQAAGAGGLPVACVLDANGAALATFAMPDAPPAFVSTAILAARRADEIEHGNSTAFAAPATNPEPRVSIARATAKVRELSAFAAEHGRPAAMATAGGGPSADHDDAGDRYALVAWNAEPVATPSAAVAPAAPQTVAPWLDSVAVRPAAAAPIPAPAVPAPATTPASAPVATQPLPAPAQPAAPTPPKTGASAFIAAFQKPFSIFTKPAAPPKATPPAAPATPAVPPTAPPAAMAAQQPVPQAPTPASDDVHGSMPLGLEGYCPVALVDRGTWTEGRAQWGARHRGRTYLFAGPDEQRAFLANPDRYAPALSGDDPVLAFDRGSSTPGQRRYGVTYQARIYLFASPETLAAFSADPARYATRIAVAERTQPQAGAARTY